MNHRGLWIGSLVCGLGLALIAEGPARAAATLLLVAQDGAGEGLNDPAPVTPAGGNTATSLGEARRQAVQFALSLWAQTLESEVPIRVAVTFDPLGGTPTGAVLGVGGPEEVYRDFAGAAVSGTWYPAALADAQAGIDLSAGTAVDLSVTFNSDVDGPVVFGDGGFYYGFDHYPPAGNVSFVSVALHELAHGLGFTTFVDGATGEKLLGYDDAFMRHLERHGASPADFPSMTDPQRQQASVAVGEVHWTGPATVAAGGVLSAGRTPEGHVEVYVPPTYASGASLRHFATSLLPDQVLEPFYLTSANLEWTLPMALLEDLGWPAADPCLPGVPIGGDP
jgi:hypothetical protein